MSQHSFRGRAAQKHAQLVFSTYGRICHLCGQPGANTVDHLIPRSHGGDNSLENSRPACAGCNSARGNKPLSQWFFEQKKKKNKTQNKKQQSMGSGGYDYSSHEPQVKPSRNW
jgi:5-methylcytosine-specific restriction endonuclease McrA